MLDSRYASVLRLHESSSQEVKEFSFPYFNAFMCGPDVHYCKACTVRFSTRQTYSTLANFSSKLLHVFERKKFHWKPFL